METRPLLTGDTTTTGQDQPYGLVDALTNISGPNMTHRHEPLPDRSRPRGPAPARPGSADRELAVGQPVARRTLVGP